MIANLGREENEEWQCLSCDTLLKLEDISIDYMNDHFTVEIPCCTGCGMALVLEDIAPGKMLGVKKKCWKTNKSMTQPLYKSPALQKLTEPVRHPEALGLQDSLLSR